MGPGRFDLTGKCAVVIGGTSGLGKAIALALAEAGADVVAASRRQEETQKVAKQIEALGRRTLRATVDIRDRSSIESLQQKVLETFRKVDILVNAAGITLKTPTLECSEEGWNSVIDINLNGTWRCCQIFGKTMVSQGFGKILNIASLSTFVAFNQVAAYGVSSPPLPVGWASWTFWQYTSSATIPGITGNVDASYSNGAIAALVAPQQPGRPVTGGRARDAAHGVVNW